MHKLVLALFVGSVYNAPVSSDFVAFIKEQQQKPEIIQAEQNLVEQAKPSYTTDNDNAEYESIKSTLNKLVALYALIHVSYLGYQRYCGNNQSNGVSGAVKDFLISWAPGPLSKVIKGSDFIVDCSTIAIQALVIKAVANMILFCAYKDVIDGVEYSLLRFKKMVIRILLY